MHHLAPPCKIEEIPEIDAVVISVSGTRTKAIVSTDTHFYLFFSTTTMTSMSRKNFQNPEFSLTMDN